MNSTNSNPVNATLLSAAILTSSAVAVNLPAQSVVSNIITINSLAEVQLPQTPPNKTLILIDLDDTTFDLLYTVGSKESRRNIKETAAKIDNSRNWHDIFTYMLAQKHPLKTVEPITSQLIREWQDKGYVVCGFTSRERNNWYDTEQESVDELTTNQLAQLDIYFENGSLEKNFPDLAKNSEYYGGTFFANIEPKGNFLSELFNNAEELPEYVLFFDDKHLQCKSVSTTLAEMGIQHTCSFYTATDAKAKAFNELISYIQLYQFVKSKGEVAISDELAATIANNNPDKDSEYYLREAMKLVEEF